MLAIDRPITVATAPDALVYADTDDPLRFFAFAAHPRLAPALSGRPGVGLMAFRSTPSGPLDGAQLAVTLTLGLTEDERLRIAAALVPAPPTAASASAAASADASSSSAACLPSLSAVPQVTLVAPSWRGSEVTLHLTAGVDLAGRG